MVIGLALLLRIAYLMLYAGTFPLYRAPLVDAKIYDEWARAIAGGDLWGRGEGVFYRAPLYPYLLAGLIRVLGGTLPWIAILQLISGLVTIGSCAVLARRLAGERAAVATAALLALYGPLMAAESKLLATSLGLALHALGLLLAVRAAEGGGPGRRGAAGVVWGLACLIRPQWLLLSVLVPFVLAFGTWRTAGLLALRRWSPYLLGLALIVAPVAIRNRVVGGDWVLVSSNGGMTFYQGNNEENASGLLTIVRKFDLFGSATEQRVLETRVAEREMGRALKPSETSRFWTGQALQFIRSRPLDWLRLEGRKLFRFVTGYEYADNYSFYIEQERLWPVRLAAVPFGLLLALGVAGAVLAESRRRDPRVARIVLLSFLAGFAGCLAFYVSSRYRMETAPALGVLAGAALARLIEAARGRAAWPLGSVGVGAGLLAASFLPAGAPARSQESITWLQMGNAYEAVKKPTEATAAYRRAIELLPANVFAWNNLILLSSRQETPEAAMALLERMPTEGREHPMTLYLEGHLYARLEREDEAVTAYEAALTQNPLLKEAHFNLALIYEKRRDYQRAAEHLEEARRLGDTTPDLYSHLGYIRLQQQRYGDAREALAALLRVKPEDGEGRFNLAVANFYLGELEVAGREFDALASAGEDPVLIYYRALVRLRQGDAPGAARGLERALDLASGNARAMYYLALARRGVGSVLSRGETYGEVFTEAQGELDSYFQRRAASGWGAPLDAAAERALVAIRSRPDGELLARDLERFAGEEVGARP
ncbi:MAG: tetratricopeptide repeat protein [Candidatus Eisenbacteria bacterium]|nr:tetratricopeptide repeat protein [Candidatus Eisenbacteria bacterium]